jgi:hypothetical protein
MTIRPNSIYALICLYCRGAHDTMVQLYRASEAYGLMLRFYEGADGHRLGSMSQSKVTL